MDAVKHPTDHLLQLDTHLSGLIPGTLKQSPSVVVSEHTISNKALVSQANRLLSRFPKAPQRLFTLPMSNSALFAKKQTIWDGIKDGRWPTRYLVPEARSYFQSAHGDDAASVMQGLEEMQDNAWDNLFVTSFVDTNNMVFMLKIIDSDRQPDSSFASLFQAYVNILGELVDQYDALVDAVKFGFKEIFDHPAPSVPSIESSFLPSRSQ